MKKTIILVLSIVPFVLYPACSKDADESEDGAIDQETVDEAADQETVDEAIDLETIDEAVVPEIEEVQDIDELDQPDLPPAYYEASFVVSELKVGTLDQGFNLDAENTQCTDGSCIPDGTNGIDNRLKEIFAAIGNAMGEPFPDVDGGLQEAIADGTTLIVLRLTDVDVMPMSSADATDIDVQVKVYSGADADDPANPDDNLSGHEPLDVKAESLVDPGDNIESPKIEFRECTIIRGALECSPSEFSLDLPMGERPLHLDIIAAQIEATVSRSPEESTEGVYVDGSMTDGILGGYIGIDDFLYELELLELGDISPTTLLQILANHADIDAIPEGLTSVPCDTEDDCMFWQECRSSTCYEPPDRFDSISVGFIFELTSIEFTGNIAE